MRRFKRLKQLHPFGGGSRSDDDDDPPSEAGSPTPQGGRSSQAGGHHHHFPDDDRGARRHVRARHDDIGAPDHDGGFPHPYHDHDHDHEDRDHPDHDYQDEDEDRTGLLLSGRDRRLLRRLPRAEAADEIGDTRQALSVQQTGGDG